MWKITCHQNLVSIWKISKFRIVLIYKECNVFVMKMKHTQKSQRVNGECLIKSSWVSKEIKTITLSWRQLFSALPKQPFSSCKPTNSTRQHSASSLWNPHPLKGRHISLPACYCCFLSQSSVCKGPCTQWTTVGTGTKAAVTVKGKGQTADSSGMTARRVILEHPQNSSLPRCPIRVLTYGLRMAQEIPWLFNLLTVGLPVLLLMGF